MRAVIDKDKRPNCLVLDEIDGAPAASIELLLKFIHGKLLPKGRSAKEKGQKENNGCRRPIICICNDLYTPSLRYILYWINLSKLKMLLNYIIDCIYDTNILLHPLHRIILTL